MLHAKLVGFLVALRPRRLHAGPLDALSSRNWIAVVSVLIAISPPERVNFPHHVALGLTTDRRIAAHLRDCIEIPGQHKGLRPQPCRRQRGLAARVTRPANNHIIRLMRAILKTTTHFPIQNCLKRLSSMRSLSTRPTTSPINPTASRKFSCDQFRMLAHCPIFRAASPSASTAFSARLRAVH